MELFDNLKLENQFLSVTNCDVLEFCSDMALDVVFIPMAIAITPFLTFYSFAVRTHVLFPEMISIHCISHMFRTSLHNNRDILCIKWHYLTR